LLAIFIAEVPIVLYAFLDAQAALQLVVLERWPEDEAPQFMAELFIVFLIIDVPFGSIDTGVYHLRLEDIDDGLFFSF
jgi:hypothetical protein